MKKIDKLPEVSSIPQTSLYSTGAVNIIENVRNRTAPHYSNAPSFQEGTLPISSYGQSADRMSIQYVSGLKTSKETLKELVHTLEGLAYIDMLTGIPNRGALESFFDNSIKTSIRDSDYITVFLLDIDDFKVVNDTYGHKIGDECLKSVARTMNEQKRSTDKLGRFGGEEFIYIMKHETVSDREIVAERLRRAVAENTNVTVSIGVHTIFPKELLPGKILLEKDIASVKTQAYDLADRALYQAKHNGKNRVGYFSFENEEGLISPLVQSAELLTIPTISSSASIHSESFVPGKVVQVAHASHNLQEVI